MKLSKKQLKSVRKIATSLSIVGALTIGSITVTEAFVGLVKNEKYLEDHFKLEQKQIQYLKNVHDANLDEYDINFVNFYREGSLVVGEKKYLISELYILEGEEHGEDKFHLVSYKDSKCDVLTNKPLVDFEKSNVFPLKRMYLCYQLYQQFGLTNNELILENDDIPKAQSLLASFDKTTQQLVPETFYMDNDSEERKSK